VGDTVLISMHSQHSLLCSGLPVGDLELRRTRIKIAHGASTQFVCHFRLIDV